MSVVIFIIILAILIIVHEYGHFFVAKKGGIRVDEFGLGFGPRVAKLFSRKGTNFTLNILPFGGFVKIYGEDPDDVAGSPDESRALVSKPAWVQALVLFAGPFMNFLFAWVVVLATLLVGLPTTIDESFRPEFVHGERTMIVQVLPDSPAELSGLKVGYKIESIVVNGTTYTIRESEELRDLVLQNLNSEFEIYYSWNASKSPEQVILKPAVTDNGEKLLGLGIAEFGIYQPNFWMAIPESFRFTGAMIGNIAIALWNLLKGLVVGGADFSQVSGPIGIVGIVGDAAREGIAYILSFTALISINLGLINLIPFPALDGGRLLFLGIERVKGSRINPRLAGALNMIGFGLLIILMLVVSYRDVAKLF